MSRNFTPDETLIDRLVQNDTSAFEEIYHRYCHSLYAYCLGKTQLEEDARRIVRDIFINLWQERNALPVNFSISLYLYTEVRKAVVRCIDHKANDEEGAEFIEQNIIPGFSLTQLQKARKPVSHIESNYRSSLFPKDNYENPWWNPSTIRLQKVKVALQNMLNLW